MISFDEFEKMSDNIEVLETLDAIGVEPKHFGALAGVLFEEETKPGEYRTLTFDEFVKQVVMLRPERNASVMDVADLRHCLRADVEHCRNEHKKRIESIAGPRREMEIDIRRR